MANVNNNANLLPILPAQQPVRARGGGDWKELILGIFQVLFAIFMFVHVQSQSRDENNPFRIEYLQISELSEVSYLFIFMGSFLVSLIFIEIFIEPEPEPGQRMRLLRFFMV